MSTLSTFMEPFGRRVEMSAELQSSSKLDVVLIVKRSAAITHPIDVALALKTYGMGLGEAHKALNRIVANESVTLKLGHEDREAIVARLLELGIEAR